MARQPASFFVVNMKNNKLNQKTIAILGGMGPQASSYLLKLLIDFSVSEFRAKNGTDFPEILLLSEPIDDFISDKTKAKKALTILTDKMKALTSINPNLIAIACNSAHILLPELQKLTDAQFISIIQEVSEEIKKSNFKKIGILATPTTINSKIYHKSLQNRGIVLISPTKRELTEIEKIIRNVIAGRNSLKDSGRLYLISKNLIDRGAEGIMLACTELGIIFSRNCTFPVFDSLEILARGLLRRSYE